MYATDGQTDKSNAYCPLPYGRGHNKIESCQRWFTKRIKGLGGLDYNNSQRLEYLGLETLKEKN